MKNVQVTNNRQLMIVNNKTLFAFNMPEGISLIAVRGFFASNSRSRYRLNAIAAVRANIMQQITSANLMTKGVTEFHENECSEKVLRVFPQPIVLFKFHCPTPFSIITPSNSPRKNPIIAKGIAKIVCENFIRLK